jgi:hypothetical protein
MHRGDRHLLLRGHKRLAKNEPAAGIGRRLCNHIASLTFENPGRAIWGVLRSNQCSVASGCDALADALCDGWHSRKASPVRLRPCLSPRLTDRYMSVYALCEEDASVLDSWWWW